MKFLLAYINNNILASACAWRQKLWECFKLHIRQVNLVTGKVLKIKSSLQVYKEKLVLCMVLIFKKTLCPCGIQIVIPAAFPAPVTGSM